MKCPHCKRDIREAVVLSAAASIAARRRARQGRQITPDQARAMQLRSAAARNRNRLAAVDAASCRVRETNTGTRQDAASTRRNQ